MAPTIIVTGASGFIGRRVVSAAIEAGFSVTRLVRSRGPCNGASVVEHDLRLPLPDLPKRDWVFHLAGTYAGAGHQELSRADARIADNLIAWGLKANISNWVIASAAEIYGDVQGIATEDAPARPVIPYGRIKIAVEQRFIEHFAKIPDCRIVILRIAEVYGSEGRLMHELTARLRRGFCPWPGSGRVPVSFVHVQDVAQAFLRAVQLAGRGVSIYNVADDMPASWRDFVCEAARRLRARDPVFLPAPLVRCYGAWSFAASRIAQREPVLTRHALRLLTTPKPLSNARAKSELGFQPRYGSYLQGMEEALRGVSHHAKNGGA